MQTPSDDHIEAPEGPVIFPGAQQQHSHGPKGALPAPAPGEDCRLPRRAELAWNSRHQGPAAPPTGSWERVAAVSRTAEAEQAAGFPGATSNT